MHRVIFLAGLKAHLELFTPEIESMGFLCQLFLFLLGRLDPARCDSV